MVVSSSPLLLRDLTQTSQGSTGLQRCRNSTLMMMTATNISKRCFKWNWIRRNVPELTNMITSLEWGKTLKRLLLSCLVTNSTNSIETYKVVQSHKKSTTSGMCKGQETRTTVTSQEESTMSAISSQTTHTKVQLTMIRTLNSKSLKELTLKFGTSNSSNCKTSTMTSSTLICIQLEVSHQLTRTKSNKEGMISSWEGPV